LRYLILNQDLRKEDCLRELESNSIQLILTSPPYFNVRNYEKHSNSNPLIQNAKIYSDLNSQEKTIIEYEQYLKEMKEILFKLKRLLKRTGYIIIIISDITSNKIHFPLAINFFNLLSEFYLSRIRGLTTSPVHQNRTCDFHRIRLKPQCSISCHHDSFRFIFSDVPPSVPCHHFSLYRRKILDEEFRNRDINSFVDSTNILNHLDYMD